MPRNAKALKSRTAAIEGIKVYVGSYGTRMMVYSYWELIDFFDDGIDDGS